LLIDSQFKFLNRCVLKVTTERVDNKPVFQPQGDNKSCSILATNKQTYKRYILHQ